MEEVFMKILKDSSPLKHVSVRSACLESQELLENQHELMHSPPHEIRAKCLQALQLALETKHSKLVSHALSGFQRLIWDKTFQTHFEIANDETWIPCQLLQSVESISSQNEDVQVEIMKILVQMTNTCSYSLSTKAVIHLISMCLDVYTKGSSSLKSAAQATANQTLQVFCSMIQEPDEATEEETDESIKEDPNIIAEGVIEDLSPVLVFICGKLKNVSGCPEKKVGIPLLLQCVLSILRNLNIDIHLNLNFLKFLWQELCPLLIAFLGSPKTDKNIVSSQKSGSSEGNEIGRGSGCLAAAPSCQSVEAKTIFSIAVELVRLFGNIGSLRPVLESLFHRMLLYPPPQHRLEALKAVKEIMKNPELLLKFAGPSLHDVDDKNSRSEDLDLIRIAMDSLGECCHSSDQNTCYASASCASELLKSLEELCSGNQISEEYMREINKLFKNLEDSDYKGKKLDRWHETRQVMTPTVKCFQSNASSEYSDSDADRDEPEDTAHNVHITLEDISDDTKPEDLDADDDIKPKELDANDDIKPKELDADDDIKPEELDADDGIKPEELNPDTDIIVKPDELNPDNNISTKTEELNLGSDIGIKPEELNLGNDIGINPEEMDVNDDNGEANIKSKDTNEYRFETEKFTKHVDMEYKDANNDARNEKVNTEAVISEVSYAVRDTEDLPGTTGNFFSDSGDVDPQHSSLHLHKEKEEIRYDENLQPSSSQSKDSYHEPKVDDDKDIFNVQEEEGDIMEELPSSTSSDPVIDDDDEHLTYDLEDKEQELEELEANRLNKVPRTLLGQEDAGKLERERVDRLCTARMEFAQQERQAAHKFIDTLKDFLPYLLSLYSSVEADQAMQEFASNYCEDLWKQQQKMTDISEDVLSHITILNADGIYLATYSALLLNLKLIRNNYYQDPSASIALTEQQFIEEVHGSGVLVYLSATWLAELYQQVLVINLLEGAGYSPISSGNSALINLLSDVDGLGDSRQGSQQLADYKRLEQAAAGNQKSPSSEAGRKFSRRVLTCSWETILEVLSVLLNGTNSCGITSTIGFLLGTEGAKEEHRKARDAIAESISGLQRAAKLCNALGLQSSCSAVFAQLAATSCPLSEEQAISSIAQSNTNRKQFFSSLRNKNLRLHTSHALSMDVMLSRGLELGSHSPNCWKYVFQCCLYVLELENAYFSNCNSIPSVLKRTTLQAFKKAVDKKGSKNEMNKDNEDEDLGYQELLPMPGSALQNQLNVVEILKKSSDGVVKDQLLLEVLESLSQLVDRLFEEAAGRLNLSALIGFLVELCATSQIQLFTQSYRQQVSISHSNSLLLYHLGDIMLRCARSGRPLIHIMKAWSVVAPHFVEAACHKDHMVSKKAVTIIHDIVSALLSSNSELPHFHFNEALFKPFENLLCLELCDTDVQQQIICSMCEFVEACTTDIHSGWRPLFGALRAVRLPSANSSLSSIDSERERAHHLRVILDVFEAFLGTNNILVFAYAAIDCLLCLLKHVQSPAETSETTLEKTEDLQDTILSPDICLAALKYLERCHSILILMHNMPTCPVFNSANRIKVNTIPNGVDPVISGLDIVYFCQQNNSAESLKEGESKVQDTEQANDFSQPSVTLDSLDKHTGILHVWFLLLEGLSAATVTCHHKYQPHAMETLYGMLHNLKETAGPDFGIYCINYLLLPMLQNWLRKAAKQEKNSNSFTANFKQCCGLSTDLIVDYIQFISESSDRTLSDIPGASLALHQLFIVLTECVAQPSEIISRLGCSCIRHIILSAGKHFTSEFWDIACTSLQRACNITLHSVKQLMICFHADSDNFYGDFGEVKVAARKDCTPQEAERMKQLARQVFLLDCQRTFKRMENDVAEDDKRSFVFLLHPPQCQEAIDYENDIVRVPFCNLVVGLLSHQILLQTLATILLQGTKHTIGSITTLLSFLPVMTEINDSNNCELPGFLPKLTVKQLHILFNCLEQSYRTACDFDSRPGLKFLVQKVAQIDVAANLYKQSGVSWSSRALTLLEICLMKKEMEMKYTNELLNQRITDSTTTSVSDTVSNEHLIKLDCLDDFYVTFMKKFKDICELYTECAMDKDGLLATVDRMSDKPIFFLVAPDCIEDVSIDDIKTNDHEHTKEGHEISHCDSSDSEDLNCDNSSKDTVYSLATEQTISSLINEYKKRKTKHSMPSAFHERLRKKSSNQSKLSSSSDASVPEEILLQRRASITKDGEAHVLVYKQLVQAFMDLHLSLPEQQFQLLLPLFVPGVQYLVAYGTDAELKLVTADWLQKVATNLGFGGALRASQTNSS